MAKKAVNKESMYKWLTKNGQTLKGVALVTAGLVLIAFTSSVIIKLITLVAGALLVYAGLIMLKANSITKLIDDVIRKIH